MPTIGGKKGNPPPRPGENNKYQKSGGEMQAERDRRKQEREDIAEDQRFAEEYGVGAKEKDTDGDSES